ncbi:hypothetical protein [Streptomyces sp. NPDC050392]|uniref:hypothetical protein n=1 Tax=Streptomyces sp. NPDC050392 TaxID=3155782 RepID=UPI003428BF71
MDGKLIIDDLRVQELELADGTFAYTILWPEGATHREADGFLRTRQPGTDRTYAFHLVDHLRWLEHEGLTLASVTLDDLYRYMGAVGAKITGPYGQPWRTGKQPYEHSTLKLVASCLKGFYLHVSGLGINEELGKRLDRSRLPTRRDGRPERPHGSEAETAWRERALNAEDGLKSAHAEIRRQRSRMGQLLGQIRDLEARWSDESVTRLAEQNAQLTQRVQQLSQDQRQMRNEHRRPGRTTGSRTAASPNWKHNCWNTPAAAERPCSPR